MNLNVTDPDSVYGVDQSQAGLVGLAEHDSQIKAENSHNETIWNKFRDEFHSNSIFNYLYTWFVVKRPTERLYIP